MNISAHSSLYAPNIGGIETMVHEMEGALRAKGHSLSVVTKRLPETLPESEVIDGISIHRTPAGFDEEAIINNAWHLHENGAQLMDNIDAVHIVGMRRPFPMASAILSSLTNTPVVSSICGLEVPNPGSAESTELWEQGIAYMPDTYRNVDKHTAVSSATRDYAVAALPEYKDRIDVLLAGIDYHHYDSLPTVQPEGVETPYFMSLRRLDPSKGIDVLIKAYARLLDDNASTEPDLVIAGDGSERQKLEAMVESLRISKRVHFVGSIGLDAALGMLKGAVATIVPSTAEAGGLVNTEANAVGCALIASDVGGIREYTTDQAALLVKPNDDKELAAALHTIMEDTHLKSGMIEAGKVFAQSRDWSEVIKDYVRLYETARPIDPSKLHLLSTLSKRVFNILENGHDKI